MLFNYLPNDKILDVTKLKALTGAKLNGTRMVISLFDKSRKHCAKRKKCCLPAFSPVPTLFSKAFSRVVNSRDCMVKN